MIDPNELERLTNPKEALEEAYETIFGKSAIWHEQYGLVSDSFRGSRYLRFLNAEAWTDAALMLIPDNWTAWEMRSHAARSHFSADLSRLSECDAGQEDWAHGRGMHPALALAEAALRAKEAGNG